MFRSLTYLFSSKPSENTGIIAQDAKVGTWNAITTIDSFNTTVHEAIVNEVAGTTVAWNANTTISSFNSTFHAVAGTTVVRAVRASGGWFSIRSKANADHYWYYDEALGCIIVSDTQRTSFKISAQNMHDGAIMVGVDTVILVVRHIGFVVPRFPNGSSGVIVLGVTPTQTEAFRFKFDELDKGRFVPLKDELPSPLCYVPQGGVSAGWELAL